MEQLIITDNSSVWMKRFRVIAILFSIACMIMIFRFSSDNAVQSSALSQAVVRKFIDIVYALTGKNLELSLSPSSLIMLEYAFRKMAHMFIYFLLCICIMFVFLTFRIPMILRMIGSVGICFAYSLTDEFHQGFVDGRGPAFTDCLFDTSGAIIGCIVALIIFCIIHTIYYTYVTKKARRSGNSRKMTSSNGSSTHSSTQQSAPRHAK